MEALTLSTMFTYLLYGLTMDESPPLLTCIANELLQTTYSQFLKSYLGGSVLEDGAAGAIFAIPEFDCLTKSFSLPSV